MSVSSRAEQDLRSGKFMLIGIDQNRILEKRFHALGYRVTAVEDGRAAVNCFRHEVFDAAVLVSEGSLMNDAETIFNLKDIRPAMEITVLIKSRQRNSSRLLRQLIEHPIKGTRVMTRRELQKHLQSAAHLSPRGGPPRSE